jgi:serine/threonine protein kinase
VNTKADNDFSSRIHCSSGATPPAIGDNSSHEEALFAGALALPSHERGEFLAQQCGADAVLYSRLVELIEAHEAETSFMSKMVLATETAVSPEEQPGDMIGCYQLLQRLGEGGCGVVWMAEQRAPIRRRVALKLIKLGMDTKEVIARFEAERQALAMMNHPHIAKIYDAGSSERGRPYFVMELVSGIPINRYCDDNHLTPEARLELIIKVCEAVEHAHRKGIIHRDLKPSNILVALNDGVATPKVIDFGIAKSTRGRLTDATLFTKFEHFIGTPAYMSPEQAGMNLLGIDVRTDIYSLGVLLYELLTGRPPFDAKAFAHAGVDEIRVRIREEDPPKPSTRIATMAAADREAVARVRATMPPQLSRLLRGNLDWIVMRCLEKDRTRRYETANGLALDIRRHLEHQPVAARPPSAVYLLQNLARRNRTLVTAAGAAIAALGIASTSTFVGLRFFGSAELSAEATPPAHKSIAVLPFANLGPDPDNACFAEGVHEDVIASLAKTRDLKVVSRTSVLAYRNSATKNLRKIARDLGVAMVLEGSVRRAGNRIRVVMQLIDARTDQHLWAETYNKDVGDVFTLQAALAEEISRALNANLGGSERTLIAKAPRESTGP